MEKVDKRRRLAAAAADLTHRQGFSATSLADIAGDAGVPLGNVYYYYKTKEEIGEAIVDERLTQFSAMRAKLERVVSPRVRLKAFVRMTVDNRKVLAQSGCPNGTLSSELRKQGGALGQKCAMLFSEPLEWMTAQFRAIGLGSESKAHAIHLMAVLQGIAVLAHTFGDPEIVVREARRLNNWIDGLEGNKHAGLAR